MKSTKKKSKTRSKSKPHTRSKAHTKSKIRARATTKNAHSSIVGSIVGATPSLNVTLNPALKTCQEVEIGDIGGFGSPEELEEHEKRCSEPATEFCSNCGKNLCRNHYDLIHRDHDASAHPNSSNLV